MQQKAINYISESEYLEIERNSEIKSEYYNGEIFGMSGASEKHNLIVSNLIFSLQLQLRKSPCRIYPSDMRLKIKTGLYTYPDIMVICGQRKFDDEKFDTLLNPDVIIEVLSNSTETYDRGRKFQHYQQIDSLKEYVMISQHSQKIEKYSINKKGNWVLAESDENNPYIILESLECKLEHSEIYYKT
ncbi:MAG: Uma2 family endonuclease [Desulfobacteraceae bacterium]|nr:Uma2 family endonuclease [Desulfobacteraceae bacterium]